LKKITGSIRFPFFKPETGKKESNQKKTEPNKKRAKQKTSQTGKNRAKTGKNRVKSKKPTKPEKTKSYQKN